MTESLSFDDAINEFAAYDDLIITKSGSLMTGFELSGIEPDATTYDMRFQLTLSQANFIESLPDTVNYTQYYIKMDGHKIEMKDREEPLPKLLSERRVKYINKKNLSVTKLIHTLESRKESVVDSISYLQTVKDIFIYPFSNEARERIKSSLSVRGHLLHSIRSIDEAKEILHTAVQESKEYYQNFMNIKQLDPVDIAHFLGFLSSLDNDYFKGNQIQPEHFSEGIPGIVSSCFVQPVLIDGIHFLKFSGATAKYARILSLSEYITEKISPGLIVSHVLNPLMVNGSFILMNRYKPLTEISTPEFFRQQSVSVEQSDINFTGLLTGKERASDVDKKTLRKKSQEDKLQDIDVEKNINARHSFINSQVLMFGDSPEEINKNCKDMVSSMARIGMRMVYEDSLRKDSYTSFFPCSSKVSFRDLKSNSCQFAASSYIYKASEGKKIIEDYGNEEFLYPFQSKDGSPFYYSPFVNGRGLVLIIGPIRSGKSFFRKTTATHFSKYGGFIRMVDPDPGSEKIAKIFGENGSLFKISPDDNAGFNLFSTCLGKDDFLFQEHFLWTIELLISLNPSKEMQVLTKKEQIELDTYLKLVMGYKEELRTFYNLYNHFSMGLKDKLKRFVRGGVYGSICDCDVDAVAGMEKMVSAFNIQGVKDMEQILPFVMYEIFFRIRRLFENKDYRQRAKLADIDEAHLFLKIPGVMKMISDNVRTWGKWLGSISLTTQSPQELFEMNDWPMLRSSSSTWVFFADPQIDIDLYQESFQLTETEMLHIARLKPRKEAYIIQREIGVSKTIIIDVEAEQYVINTSKASEEQMTIDNITKYGAIKGVEKSIKELGLEVTT